MKIRHPEYEYNICKMVKYVNNLNSYHVDLKR